MTGKRWMATILLTATAMILSTAISSQENLTKRGEPCAVPLNRQIFHDNVDSAQKKLGEISPESGLFIDELQCAIESDSLIRGQDKVRYLRGIEDLLNNYAAKYRGSSNREAILRESLEVYKASLSADEKGGSVAAVIARAEYEAGELVVRGSKIAFEKNSGYKASQDLLVLKYCRLYPDRTFQTLKENPDVPFADSLVKAVARRFPSQLYTYAQANNKLGYRIRNMVNDKFVRTVVRMSGSKSGQQYFPFLDEVVNDRITLAQLDSVEKDPAVYYHLLVNTRIEYVRRALDKDTAIGYADLEMRLQQKAGDVFVTTINGLHERPDVIRFKSIQDMPAEDLYYLAVLTDGLIYTSSYTSGVYPLMMKKINGRGDSLLQAVHYDHYRKFISQAAAYNTLGNFLSTFPDPKDADGLMKRFVSRLEESNGLEDGVDVADSYASIAETLPGRAAEMLKSVQANLDRSRSAGNQRGVIIYHILDRLFQSADSSGKIDLTAELGIPPVYHVPFSSLTNANGEVVMQVFFFGDEDGKTDFRIFQSMFARPQWTIDKTNPQWIAIRSARGKQVTMYANIPFDEETGKDDEAQSSLRDYLRKNDIQPTVTINRGHSYHANTTIAYMAPSSRVVFMGSCGGFNLTNAILEKSPDAHIVASKQIGKRDINKPFIQLLTEKLREGSDIDWLPFWKEFRKNARVEGFEDYIPPFKNLGVIFIKAYRNAQEKESGQ